MGPRPRPRPRRDRCGRAARGGCHRSSAIASPPCPTNKPSTREHTRESPATCAQLAADAPQHAPSAHREQPAHRPHSGAADRPAQSLQPCRLLRSGWRRRRCAPTTPGTVRRGGEPADRMRRAASGARADRITCDCTAHPHGAPLKWPIVGSACTQYPLLLLTGRIAICPRSATGRQKQVGAPRAKSRCGT